MNRIINVNNMSFKLRQSPIPEFSWHTSENFSKMLGSEHMQINVRSLDPDKFSYPYHFHRNSEELFVILSGRAILRTHDDFIEVSDGDIIFFEMGPTGAHQLYNHTEEACIYLDIRTVLDMDVCEYPDSGKINILPNQEIYQTRDRVDYYKGEDKVREKWPDSIVKKG